MVAGADTTLEKPEGKNELVPQSRCAWVAGHVKQKPRMRKNVMRSAKHLLQPVDTTLEKPA